MSDPKSRNQEGKPARGVAEGPPVIGARAARRLNAIEGVRLDMPSRRLMRQVKAQPVSAEQRRWLALDYFKAGR